MSGKGRSDYIAPRFEVASFVSADAHCCISSALLKRAPAAEAQPEEEARTAAPGCYEAAGCSLWLVDGVSSATAHVLLLRHALLG